MDAFLPRSSTDCANTLLYNAADSYVSGCQRCNSEMVIKLSAAGITKGTTNIFQKNYWNSEILEIKFFSKTHSQYPYLI